MDYDIMIMFNVVTGKGNSLLKYSEGEITLTYKDGQNGCQTLIKFHCDYSRGGKQGKYLTDIFIYWTISCLTYVLNSARQS